MSASTDSFDEFDQEEDPFAEFGFEKPTGRIRSLASAPIKGAIKGTAEASSISPTALGPISISGGKKILDQVLKTREELPEQLLERSGKLIPYLVGGPETLLQKFLALGGGVGAGQLAQEGGLGETGQNIAEAVGMGIPGIVSGTREALQKSVPSKLPSGLKEPRAIEAKAPKLAKITPARQEKAIAQLNEQASELAQKSLEKHVPISKEIEKGLDFEKRFEEGFTDIKKAADKANPEIDITPISRFMKDARNKYKGIPKLHPQAMKVTSELRAFSNKPQTSLSNLLKIYRSNNQKVKQIYETSQLTGKQKEYVDFLNGYNKSIADSFKNTLPKDSAWIKQFEKLNQEFRDFQKAKKVTDTLQSIIGKQPTAANIEKLATNKKVQDKLALSMGQEGAKEIAQIAQDLKKAVEAIKKIPVKERKIYENVLPFSFFIPGIGKILGGGSIALKGAKEGQFLYGRFLSSTRRRKLLSNVIKSIKEKNILSYRKAVQDLKHELNINSKDEFKEFGF